jgi:hypothetical protein
MDFKHTIDIIIKDLRELREIIDDFKNYPEVPGIQVELAKSKCKSTEEIIALLKNYQQGDKAGTASEKAVMDTGEQQAEIADVTVTLEKSEEPVTRYVEEPVKKDNEADKEQKAKSKGTKIIADSFNKTTNTLFDQFGDKNPEDDFASMLKTKHVDNLADAIGINDKFLFIREIFGGNSSSYEEALVKLNDAESFSDATAIIMSYTDEGESNAVVKQLLAIVKRKLTSDG